MAGSDVPGGVPLGRRHAKFHASFLWVGLAAAIFGGFAIGGHLSAVIGFGYPLGASFPALLQAHGHAQQLDVLTRRRLVERPARFLFSGPDRAPTRPGLPDYGEFGRLERLVHSASRGSSLRPALR
jgi:hypothetical protein